MSKSISKGRTKKSEADHEASSNRVMIICYSALGAFILLVLFLGQTTMFDPSYEPIYAEYEAIRAEGKSLEEERASAVQWKAFAEQAAERIQPLQDRLLEDCEDHPSDSGRGAMLSYVGFKSEGEKTQAIRRPLVQLGYKLLTEIKKTSEQRNSRKPRKFEDDGIVDTLKRARAGLDGVEITKKYDRNRRTDQTAEFDWVLWGIVLVDGILIVVIVGPSIRRWYES